MEWEAYLGLMATMGMLYLLLLAVAGLPLWWLTRKRVDWCVADGLTTVLPFAVWVALMVNSSGKSLSNVVCETLCIWMAVAGVLIARAVHGRGRDARALAWAGLLFAMLVAGGLWAFMPCLPE